jgi:hypothetical protein
MLFQPGGTESGYLWSLMTFIVGGCCEVRRGAEECGLAVLHAAAAGAVKMIYFEAA